MVKLRFNALQTAALLLLLVVSTVTRGDEAAFTFAWLSDTHVGSATGAEDLRETVRDINSQMNLSFVLISGDVTEYGSLDQLQLAKSILDELTIPCHVIPGNHDTKWSESGATDFPRIWQTDRFVFDQGGFRFIGMHQGPVMKMGDGHWAPQDVRWLKETLDATPPRQPVIFVTHYPIDEGIANWFVVLELLKKRNTQLVLCGHGHANHQYLFEGIPGVMGRSNLRARANKGGYNLVRVDGKQMTFSERTPGDGTAKPWHSVELRERDFSADTNSYPRPDFGVNKRFPGVAPVWARNTGFTIAGSPAVTKDRAIVGDASGTVYGLDLASGTTKWTFKAKGPVYTTPAVSGDVAAFASADGSIYAVATRNGQQRWAYATTRPIVASPAVADGVVYIGSSEGKFRALQLKSGKTLWEFPHLRGFVETKPLIHLGKVFFGAWDENFYALDAKTGKLVWKWHGETPGTLYSPAACWPVAANHKVFIVAPDRKMTAIEEATGAEVWRTGDCVVRESLGLSGEGTRLYVRSMNNRFCAYSTAAAHPEKLWETDAGFGYDINSAMLVEREGVVFYGTKNGLIFALDGKTGAVRWEHRMGVGIVNTLLPLSRDRVLATDFDGAIVLLRAAGSPK